MAAQAGFNQQMSNQLLTSLHQVIEGQNPFAGTSENKIQEIYALAYTLYGNKEYAEASHLFRLLILARPADVKYWKAFGACLQMLKEYEQAIDCYQTAQNLNRDRPDPYLNVYIADCYFTMQKPEAGLKALETALSLAAQRHDQYILSHVEFMRSVWLK